ncbi:MAG: hypothetical protein Q9168_007470 [Polycauliona sp. 1 TL-2023]
MIRTWHGWTESNKLKDQKQRNRLRKLPPWIPSTKRTDYNWIFWDPTGDLQRKFNEAKEKTFLRFLPRWMRSSPFGSTDPDLEAARSSGVRDSDDTCDSTHANTLAVLGRRWHHRWRQAKTWASSSDTCIGDAEYDLEEQSTNYTPQEDDENLPKNESVNTIRLRRPRKHSDDSTYELDSADVQRATNTLLIAPTAVSNLQRLFRKPSSSTVRPPQLPPPSPPIQSDESRQRMEAENSKREEQIRANQYNQFLERYMASLDRAIAEGPAIAAAMAANVPKGAAVPVPNAYYAYCAWQRRLASRREHPVPGGPRAASGTPTFRPAVPFPFTFTVTAENSTRRRSLSDLLAETRTLRRSFSGAGLLATENGTDTDSPARFSFHPQPPPSEIYVRRKRAGTRATVDSEMDKEAEGMSIIEPRDCGIDAEREGEGDGDAFDPEEYERPGEGDGEDGDGGASDGDGSWEDWMESVS